MGTTLIYLLVVAVVAAAVFGLAVLLFGRGEELAPLPPGATPTRLPSAEVTGADVRDLRFQQAVRGYRMDEVDWALGRLADELDRSATEREELLARVVELEARAAAAAGPTELAEHDGFLAHAEPAVPPTGGDQHEGDRNGTDPTDHHATDHHSTDHHSTDRSGTDCSRAERAGIGRGDIERDGVLAGRTAEEDDG